MALFDWIPRLDPRKPLPSSTGTSGIPVVLLHGGYSTPKAFGALATTLNDIGRPFIAPAYANNGTGSLADGLRELTAICSGFRKIDIVGHSLGGIMAVQLARQKEMLGKISTIIGMGTPWRGLPTKGHISKIVGQAYEDLRGPFEVNDIDPDVRVYSVVSTADKTVNPKFSQFGEVIVLDGSVSHAALPKQTKVITSLLKTADAPV